MTDVFVGFTFDEETECELLKFSKHGVSMASNQYQLGFLKGLAKPVRILTTLSVGSFPKANKRFWFAKKKKVTPYGEITYLPFVNFYGIKECMFQSALYRELAALIKQQEHTNVYVYSLYMPSLKVVSKLKKKYKDKFTLYMIIPDLPGKYGLVRKGLKGIKDRAEVKKKMLLPNCADKFVFLTENMKELFVPKPYAVVEGFLPNCEFDYSNERIPKSVLYTGSLNRAYGFGTLLEAFSSIEDPQAQLWICGAGDMEQTLKAAAERDGRIHFKGFLPKKEIAKLQTQCDVLINPRTDEGEYTKYSFPSKTMEYLLSGSKVVMYRLAGVGEEYYRYIRTIEGSGPAAMAEAILAAWADGDFYNAQSREQIEWIREAKHSEKLVQTVVM